MQNKFTLEQIKENVFEFQIKRKGREGGDNIEFLSFSIPFLSQTFEEKKTKVR